MSCIVWGANRRREAWEQKGEASCGAALGCLVVLGSVWRLAGLGTASLCSCPHVSSQQLQGCHQGGVEGAGTAPVVGTAVTNSVSNGSQSISLNKLLRSYLAGNC